MDQLPYSLNFFENKNAVKDSQIRLLVSLLITLPLFSFSLLSPHFSFLQIISSNYNSYILLSLSSAVLFIGGWPFFKGCLKEICSLNFGIMTLWSLTLVILFFGGIANIFGYSDLCFWKSVILIDVLLLSQILFLYSKPSLKSLISRAIKPNYNDYHNETFYRKINLNNHILIKPGEIIPSDGFILQGDTIISESMITEEYNPILKKCGSKVKAGSLNLFGSIIICVDSLPIELPKFKHYINHSLLLNSLNFKLADLTVKLFSSAVIVISLICFIIWKFVINTDLAFSLERMLTVMIIAFPNAIEITVPLLLTISSLSCAANGILIKNIKAFEKARKIQFIFFDKTGILTEGNFGVADITLFHKRINSDELIKYAASVEKHSKHPIAKGIIQFSDETFQADNFADINGKGVCAIVKGKNVKVVTLNYLIEHNIHLSTSHVNHIKEDGKNIVYILINEELYGAITLCDPIRAESYAAIKMLQKMKIKTSMITADDKNVASYLARELHIDEYHTISQSEEKTDRINSVRNQGLLTASISNNIPNLDPSDKADICFEFNNNIDTASKNSDIFMMNNNLLNIIEIVKLSKSTHNKIFQNLSFTIAYNIIAVSIASGLLSRWGIMLNPLSGAILMMLSTLFIIFNSRSLHFCRS